MKNLAVFLYVVMLFSFISCVQENEVFPAPENKEEAVVEMIFLSAPNTRSFTPEEMENIALGTDDERKINNLDLLVFKNDQFRYRRNAVKQSADNNNIFRATLKVDEELTVYFVANARDLVDKLEEDGEIVEDSFVSWETVREKLIDENPQRFIQNTSDRKNLPMWGMKSGLKVADNSIEYWSGISLLRAVAGVDIYLNQAVSNFTLTDARLYFVPDRGSWAPSTQNYNQSSNSWNSESPLGMKTSLTLGPIIASDNKVANQFYLYDNDTQEDTFVKEGENIRRYTRVVVGGVYNSQTYYYPIDFLVENVSEGKITYDQISRNTKYLFEIIEVTGPGYPTPEVASEEPPIHMTTHVYNWNVQDNTEVGYDGVYYVSLERKTSVLGRSAGSIDLLNITSNAMPETITINFSTKVNGVQTELESGSGIKNDRFSIEKVLNDEGTAIKKLKITALGDYDSSNLSGNKDYVIVRAGNVQFTISITQLNTGSNDWESGGEEEIDL